MRTALTIGFIVFLGVLSGCKKDDLAAPEQFFYLRNNNADMPVWVEGNLASNKFLLLVHGGPGGNSLIYNTAIPEFSDKIEQDYAVVYWDQRGSGNSFGNYGSESLTIDQFVDDLDALVDLLYSRYGATIEVYLMGHSWGGTLTAAYLLDQQRQAKIDAWIEVDGAHNFEMVDEIMDLFVASANSQIAAGNSTEEWQEILDFVEGLDKENLSDNELTQLNVYGHEVEIYLEEADSISGYTAGSAGDQLRYLFASPYNPTMASISGLVTNFGMMDNLRNIDYTPQLGQITIPSLFLWGKFDHVCPLENGIQAYNATGATQKSLIIFPRSGHSPMVTQPTAFARELKAFLDAL